MKEVNLIEHIKDMNGRYSDATEIIINEDAGAEYTVKYLENQDDLFGDRLYSKYPYYRMRGKLVDKETAFKIIAETDCKYNTHLSCFDSSKTNDDIINKWVRKNGIGGFQPFGWCHPDGTIGCNWHTTKYPDYNEVLNEVINIKLDFPFLEFMVAFSFWNCEAPYVGETMCKIRESYADEDEGDEVAEQYLYKEDYPDFADNIELLIYVHDKVFEVYYGKEETSKKYKELIPKLQDKPDLKYVNHYYEEFWFKEEELEQRIKEDNIDIDLNILKNKYDNEYNKEYEKVFNQYLVKREDIEKYRIEHGLSNATIDDIIKSTTIG